MVLCLKSTVVHHVNLTREGRFVDDDEDHSIADVFYDVSLGHLHSFQLKFDDLVLFHGQLHLGGV